MLLTFQIGERLKTMHLQGTEHVHANGTLCTVLSGSQSYLALLDCDVRYGELAGWFLPHSIDISTHRAAKFRYIIDGTAQAPCELADFSVWV